jgi:hypothetical protein
MDSSLPPRASPEPLPFHAEMVRHLKHEEAGLWKWFSSSSNRLHQADAVRLELLKSTYRIEAATHPKLYAMATEVLQQYGLECPITFYQAQSAGGMNAALAFVPQEVHVVFAGPVLSALSEAELRAVVGHEVAHFVFYRAWDGDYLAAADLLRALSQDPQATPVHQESLRLFDLYTEVFADRGALFCAGDTSVAITALLKVGTGLSEVSAESYLRQAEEIFSASREPANDFTHPEPYIRARALKLWASGGADVRPEIERMIQGAWSMERLDLVRQRRLSAATRRLLQEFLEPAWLRSDAVLAHARLFFADFGSEEPAKPPATPGFLELLDCAEPSLHDYFCYVLLDFVTVDRDATEPALAAALLLCRRAGLAKRFGEIAVKELGLAKKQFAKLERDAEAIVAACDAAATEPTPAPSAKPQATDHA